MKLSFVRPYLSITSLAETELPRFTLLTGLNGTGKTHLLKAIEQGHILTDVATRVRQEIRYFDWTTFAPSQPGTVGSDDGRGLSKAWDKVMRLLANFRSEASATVEWAKGCSVSVKGPDPPSSIALLSVNDLKQRLPATSDAREMHRSIQERRDQELEQFSSDPDVEPYVRKLNDIARAHGLKRAIDVPAEYFEDDRIFMLNGSSDPFESAFGQLFVNYRNLQIVNMLQQIREGKTKQRVGALSDDEFIAKYNKPPWEIVNQAFSDAQLPFEIDHPDLFSYSPYMPKLRKRGKNQEIDFSQLSSGEKILMSLASCLYRTNERRQFTEFPKLLLLDEVDAPLHPSMSRHFLKIVNEILIEKQGVYVIAATHNPSTIAQAPEESVFVMRAEGDDRISKKSRSEALEILTEGYATLEEGLKLFDEVSKTSVSIISEGHNAHYIAKALLLFGIDDAEVVTGVEDITGDTQLKTLFDFFAKIPHSKPIIFVWDCDVTKHKKLTATNNTRPFVFDKMDNPICPKGIENLFDARLFEGFIEERKKPNGIVTKEFC